MDNFLTVLRVLILWGINDNRSDNEINCLLARVKYLIYNFCDGINVNGGVSTY